MIRIASWGWFLLLVLACVVARGESVSDELLGQGMHAYFRGDDRRAFNLLSEAISVGSKNPTVYYYRGLAQMRLGREPDAAMDFSRGAQLEATGRRDREDVSADLARVQGPARLTIERYRNEALAQAHGASLPPDQSPAVPRLSTTPPPSTFAPPTDSAPVSESVSTPAPAMTPPAANPFAPATSTPPAATTPATPGATGIFGDVPSETGTPPEATSTLPAATAGSTAAPASTAATPAMATPAAGPAAELGPDETVKNALAAVADNQPQKLWAMLPAKYQQDIESLIHEFGQTMDSELWQTSMGVLLKTSQMLKAKAEMIWASPLVASQQLSIDQAKFTQAVNGLADALQQIATSEIATVDGLANLDAQAFLSGTVAKLLAGSGDSVAVLSNAEAQTARDDMKNATVAVLADDGQTAVVTIQQGGGEPRPVRLKRVDGKWLPAEIVDQWNDEVDRLRAALGEVDFSGAMKVQGLAALGMAEQFVTSLQAAQTQEEFNAALNNLTSMAAGLGLGGGMGGMPQSGEPAPSVPRALAPPLGTGPGGDSLPPTTVPPPVNPPSTSPPPAVPMPTAPPPNPFG